MYKKTHRANPLIKTPKKREWVTGYKSAFEPLNGKTFEQVTTGHVWTVDRLMKIEEVFTEDDEYSHCLMMWSAECSGCGTTQQIDRRELKRGANCANCFAHLKLTKRQLKAHEEREALQAKFDRAREAAQLDTEILKLVPKGLSVAEIAKALDVMPGLVQARLRTLGTKTLQPKRTKGLRLPGSVSKEELKRRARVAARIARGMEPISAQTEGKLKTGPKGPWKHQNG